MKITSYKGNHVGTKYICHLWIISEKLLWGTYEIPGEGTEGILYDFKGEVEAAQWDSFKQFYWEAMTRFSSVSSRRFLTRFRMTLMMEVVMAKSTYWTWMTLSQSMLLSRQDFLKIVELLLKCLFKVLRSELRFLMKSPRLRMTSELRLLMMSSRLKFFMTRLRVFTTRTGLRVFTTRTGLRVLTTRTGLRVFTTDCESSRRIASLHN